MATRTYRELSRINTFEGRYSYLQLAGEVGARTFGHERWINQEFYRSREWRDVRDFVIVRDNGCDLGFPDHEIFGRIYIHHINPMTPEDIKHSDDMILDPENLITTCHQTHNAIHYGDEGLLPRPFVPRSAGDTNLW